MIVAPAHNPWWKYAVLAALILGPLCWIFSFEPIAQDASYHDFADTRRLAGIPNGVDVLSNLPFLLVAVMGLRFCLKTEPGATRRAWTTFFAGVGLVSIGSAWYHWHPTHASLVWDRLPMAIAFMGFFVALLGEYVSNRLSGSLLLPAAALGIASVLYWHWTDDLRLYLWIQILPLLAVPAVMILFRSGYMHQWMLLGALAWYVLAKVMELNDLVIYNGTREIVSGHSVKHLLGAAACYSILLMLQRRKPVA